VAFREAHNKLTNKKYLGKGNELIASADALLWLCVAFFGFFSLYSRDRKQYVLLDVHHLAL